MRQEIIGGKLILKWVLKKQRVKVSTGFNWAIVGSIGEIL
jgi:hypothetical protein